jgi:hypothetical protein
LATKFMTSRMPPGCRTGATPIRSGATFADIAINMTALKGEQ